MDLSEEKAKDILEFLARKIGCDNISFAKSMNDAYNYIIVCECLGCYAVCDTRLMPIGVCSPLYAKILEGLLEMSKDGKDIFCVSIFCASRKKLFLHARASLEEILIEMDLDNGLKRRKS